MAVDREAIESRYRHYIRVSPHTAVADVLDLLEEVDRLGHEGPPLDKVTRLELIDSDDGRLFVIYAASVSMSIQDDGQTLKLFIDPLEGPDAG